MIELRTLGGLELLSSGGTPIGSVLAQPRRTALLCYLALARPRGFHSRDTLCVLFWPEHDANQSRHALRQSLYFLRRALGSNAVVSRGDGALALATDRIRCDVWEFEKAVDEQRLEAALALYAGDLLPGFHVSGAGEFERWLDEQRSRLRQRAGDATWAFAESLERTGNATRAAEWAQRAAAFHPVDEMAHRRLVLLLERAGDRGAAKRAYEAFASNLQREYEIEPSAETQALVARICSMDADRVRVDSDANAKAASSATEPSGGLGAAATGRSFTSPKPATLARRLRQLLPYSAVAFLVGAVVIGAMLQRPTTQEIARAVARELDLPAERATTPPSSQSLAAHELYQRCADPVLFRSDAGVLEKEDYCRRAIEADSTYAPAWAALALVYIRKGEAEALAERAALEALALDSSLAFAHFALGRLRLSALDLDSAEASVKRAIGLDRSDARFHELLVRIYIFTERPEAALEEARLAMRLDPLSPSINAEFAHALFANRRYDEALAQLALVSELATPLLRVAPLAAQCYIARGMWVEAIEVLRPQAKEGDAPAQALLGYVFAQNGRKDEARRILAELIERSERVKRGAYPVAMVFAALGDLEQAFIWLHRSIDDSSLGISIMEPTFAELRRDPRFARVRQRLGPGEPGR